MPTLAATIQSRLTALGIPTEQLNRIHWWDEALKRWIVLGGHQFLAAATQVQTAQVPDSVRTNLIFEISGLTARYLQYSVAENDFVEVFLRARDFVLTVDHLKGTA